MNEGHEWRYAGYFVVDVRLAAIVCLMALCITGLVLATSFRGKRWHEWVAGFVTVYSGSLLVLVLTMQALIRYPIFVVESFFKFP